MKDYNFKTFYFKLKAIHDTHVIASIDSNQIHNNDESWGLIYPAEVVNKNGIKSLELFDIDSMSIDQGDGLCVLDYNSILYYGEPTDELFKQYQMLKYLLHVDAIAS